MDDKWFFAAFVYLFISLAVASQLPDGFYSGTKFTETQVADFRQEVSSTASESTVVQLSLFSKLRSFLFLSWSVDGVPVLIGIFITFLNIISIIIVAVWAYDKIRGIGG